MKKKWMVASGAVAGGLLVLAKTMARAGVGPVPNLVEITRVAYPAC